MRCLKHLRVFDAGRSASFRAAFCRRRDAGADIGPAKAMDPRECGRRTALAAGARMRFTGGGDAVAASIGAGSAFFFLITYQAHPVSQTDSYSCK